MTYSKEWNDIYDRGEQMVCWPWSDLVSLVKRHCGDIEGKPVLELGCGAGGNRQFFVAEGADYTGMDGAQLDPQWMFGGDFTKSLPPGPYDLICDRAAVTHNDTESIKRCLGLAYDALKPGGYYIGVDWFSIQHNAFYLPALQLDAWTHSEISEGQFKGCGAVHFSSEHHLLDLFGAFEIVMLEHKQRGPEKPANQREITCASWDIVARRGT